jgi:UDP-4-amino-4-deoxy-L-arabinose formyltransferase/UDP-glucuronic acid dehydrogenase (UDP-4-keto-hexauronic acid decarboxylating)
MSSSPSVVVLAYQAMGHACLNALIQAGADIRLVLTHEDDPDETIWFPSVAELALAHQIPAAAPADPNRPDVLKQVAGAAPDFIFSFYYRHLLAHNFLALARRGAYNLHGSLLPRYRGRVPVNWAIIHGETETGVTLHRMVTRADAGAIVSQVRVPIAETDTARDVYDRMIPAAARLVAGAWPLLADGRAVETPQDESRATRFGRRRPEDGRIDWRLPAKRIHDLVRAVTHPYPGAFCFFQGRRLFVWSSGYENQPPAGDPGAVLEPGPEGGLRIATGQGELVVRAAQWEGGGEFCGNDLGRINLSAGDRLT